MTTKKKLNKPTRMIRVYTFRAKKLAKESIDKDTTVADLLENKLNN